MLPEEKLREKTLTNLGAVPVSGVPVIPMLSDQVPLSVTGSRPFNAWIKNSPRARKWPLAVPAAVPSAIERIASGSNTVPTFEPSEPTPRFGPVLYVPVPALPKPPAISGIEPL